MQLKVWDFFPTCFCAYIKGKMIFLFIILVSIYNVRDPLMFVAFNSVMPESRNSIQPEPPNMGQDTCAGHPVNTSRSSQGQNRAWGKRGHIWVFRIDSGYQSDLKGHKLMNIPHLINFKIIHNYDLGFWAQNGSLTQKLQSTDFGKKGSPP